MPNVNPIQLQKYLSGIDYPIDKDTLVEHAQDQGADEDVMSTLRQLPAQKFNSPNDIIMSSDGSIYWTDSAGGLVIPGMVADDVQRYMDVMGVFQLMPDGKEVRLVISDCNYPNGIVFSL